MNKYLKGKMFLPFFSAQWSFLLHCESRAHIDFLQLTQATYVKTMGDIQSTMLILNVLLPIRVSNCLTIVIFSLSVQLHKIYKTWMLFKLNKATENVATTVAQLQTRKITQRCGSQCHDMQLHLIHFQKIRVNRNNQTVMCCVV